MDEPKTTRTGNGMNGNRILGAIAALVVILGGIATTIIWVANISAVAQAAKSQSDTNSQAIEHKADKETIDRIYSTLDQMRQDLDDLRAQDVFTTHKKRFQAPAGQ